MELSYLKGLQPHFSTSVVSLPPDAERLGLILVKELSKGQRWGGNCKHFSEE